MLTERLIFVAVFINNDCTQHGEYLNLAELHISEPETLEGGIFQSRRPSPSDRQPREVVAFYGLTDWPYL